MRIVCVCVCVCQFSVLLSDGLLRFSLCWSDTSLSFVSHFCTLPPWMDCLVFGACAEELGVSSGGNVAGLRAINLVEIARRLPTSSQRLAILSDSQVAGCPLERWEGPFWGSFLSTMEFRGMPSEFRSIPLPFRQASAAPATVDEAEGAPKDLG